MNTPPPMIDLGLLRLVPDGDGELLSLYHSGYPDPLRVGTPSFEIDGHEHAAFRYSGIDGQRELSGGGRETCLRYTAVDTPELELTVTVRSFTHSPILRLRYTLTAAQPVALTKTHGMDQLRYLTVHQTGFETCALTEYQLSHFDPVHHAYLPNREERAPTELLSGLRFVGPVALLHTPERTLLVAYEHGADHPESFLEFTIEGTGDARCLALGARKGNYYTGQPVDATQPWKSIWFELGLHAGDLASFLSRYRRFFLEEVCENRASRQPYIYYNTWNYQERQRYFKGRPYIESMHAKRMLEEIDVAHRLGVEVFVVDTGWYARTGDWLPDLARFPQGLQQLRSRLDGYGMRLGLWFNPTVAALTSRVFREHPEWEMTWEGQPRFRDPIWETEMSTGMCLASHYAEDHIETMVRLHRELGVSYFKWDGVQQYGCDSPDHNHGTAANSAGERADCYAYEMGRAMIRIVEEVTRRCPGVIVDFDITEHGRFMGLGFLSAGKYFLVNNGPYFHEFDIPGTVKMDPDTINVFFYPGPARPRICRPGVKFDALIPSILFLTHYLPDPPRLSQANSITSLVLGGNGIWGDLPALSEDDIAYLSEQIGHYRRVRDWVTRAYPRTRGFPGSSPEIYEKLEPQSAAGIVAFFTVTPGTLTHDTQPLNLDRLGTVIGADAWESIGGNRLRLTVTLPRDGATVVYLLPRDGN